MNQISGGATPFGPNIVSFCFVSVPRSVSRSISAVLTLNLQTMEFDEVLLRLRRHTSTAFCFVGIIMRQKQTQCAHIYQPSLIFGTIVISLFHGFVQLQTVRKIPRKFTTIMKNIHTTQFPRIIIDHILFCSYMWHAHWLTLRFGNVMRTTQMDFR